MVNTPYMVPPRIKNCFNCQHYLCLPEESPCSECLVYGRLMMTQYSPVSSPIIKAADTREGMPVVVGGEK
ncbi:MAG: hypothetical protein AB9917_02005 [Negativicutes bacterium]